MNLKMHKAECWGENDSIGEYANLSSCHNLPMLGLPYFHHQNGGRLFNDIY